MATLALSCSPPTSAESLEGSRAPLQPFPSGRIAAESSGYPSVTIGLRAVHANSSRPTLDLRGHSIDREDSEAFSVDTDLLRIPCPGDYRFEAAEEDSSNGNSSAYNAMIRLAGQTTRASAPCGDTLPPVRGRLSVYLQDRFNRLFAVKGARSNGGAFQGRLTLSSLPQCGRNYMLNADVDLAGWSRGLEFKVHVLEVNETLQGRTIESERC